jgi:hypothetical protein
MKYTDGSHEHGISVARKMEEEIHTKIFLWSPLMIIDSRRIRETRLAGTHLQE